MSEAYEKSGKLACHMVNSNIAIDSLPTLRISLGNVALFEKIYYEVPILTVFSSIGKDVLYHCLNYVYDVKSVSQHDTMPIFANNY